MPKTRYFIEKSCKNRRSFGGSAPKPPLASGGWGSATDPVLLFAYAVANFLQTLGSVMYIHGAYSTAYIYAVDFMSTLAF